MKNLSTADELFGMILQHRETILAIERWSSEEDKLTWQPRFQFDNTDPIIRDSKIVGSNCGLQYGNENIFALEWSDNRQELFEDCLGVEILESLRLREVIASFGTHWKNAGSFFPADLGIKSLYPVAFMEPYSPGITLRLHELGKTKEFRNIQMIEGDHQLSFEIGYSDTGELVVNSPTQPPSIIDRGYPIYEGDVLLDQFGKVVRSGYRSSYIAERGMCEYVGRLGLTEHFKEMVCVLCSEAFWPQALSGFDIGKTGVPRYCADCHNLRSDFWKRFPADDEVRRELILRGIELAAELTGLFPFKNLKRQTIGHLEPELRDKWFMAQVFMPDSSAKTLFGSWEEMLTHTNNIGVRPRKGKGGYVSTSTCGHVCLSIGERLVCDRLDELGIEHDKEPKYPQHDELNPTGLLRGDWLIRGVWVELAGYPDDPKYMNRMAQKQQLAGVFGLDHLVLMPADLQKIDVALIQANIIKE